MWKRFFVFTLAVLTGWLLWEWLRRRQQALQAEHTPFTPHISDTQQPVAAAFAPPSPLPPEVEAVLAPDLTGRVEGTNTDALIYSSAPPVLDHPDPIDNDTAEAAEPIHELTSENTASQDTPGASDETSEEPEDLEGPVGYCMRCKAKRTIHDPHDETTETGRRMARGTCPVCGGTIVTFLKEEDNA